MALLKDIARGAFGGCAPTPVNQVAINNYLVHNELFNLLQFVNIGMGSSIGNIQATVITYDKPDAADFRNIGEEYAVSNNTPVPVTLGLKMLGGELETDRLFSRAFSNMANAIDNWTDQQIAQKINSIINSFCKYFISGNATTSPKQFDGLAVYFTKHTGQVNATKTIPALTSDNVMEVEQYFNETIAKLDGAVSCVITTRKTGKPFLQTFESYRQRGIQAIEVNDKKYQSFMGMPIVGLEDDYFPSDMTTGGAIPFIFCVFAENNGIRVAIPNDGQIFDIVRPKLGNMDSGEAVFVRKGGVEMACVPFMVDPYCASKCSIKITPADGK